MRVLKEGDGPKSTHRHEMLVDNGSTSIEANWHVRIGFYPDDAGELIRLAERLNEFDELATPEAGVAIPLSPTESGDLVI